MPYRLLRGVSVPGDVDGPNADNLLIQGDKRFAPVSAQLTEIDSLRTQAVNQGFQASLPGMTVADLHEAPHCSLRVDPGIYPARNVYRGGSYRFTKHFCGSHLIDDLQERTPGRELTEEFYAPGRLTSIFC